MSTTGATIAPKIEKVSCECIKITGAPALDPIHVFWINLELGQGYVTAICYGSAWTAYFGGMMAQTIQEFVAGVDPGYLAAKMLSPSSKKATKTEVAYLRRVAQAVIDAAKCDLAKAAT